MVTFEEALNTIRKQFPNSVVLKGFEKDNKYHFLVGSQYYVDDVKAIRNGEIPPMHFNTTNPYSVNKDDGDVYTYDWETPWALETYKLFESSKDIDVI